MPRRVEFRTEKWPISGAFTISRGAKTEAGVIVVEISKGGATGRGECVPYGRYGESLESVGRELERVLPELVEADREALQHILPPGAARNALDCALWDLEAKLAGKSVAELARLAPPQPAITAYTLSLGTPEAMAAAAARASARPVLKLKLGAEGDIERLRAVREAAPTAVLIADANEGWTENNLVENLRACAETKVALVEQPLPADKDEILRDIERRVPLCADESFHDRKSFEHIAGKYDAVNIKLDKTGGLTEALLVTKEAERRGLTIMIGCMVSTSLAMAPAMLLASRAKFVDLDGPLLLAKDREHGLRYEGSTVFPPTPELWG